MPHLSQTVRFLQSPSQPVCSDWPIDPEHFDWPNTTNASKKCNGLTIIASFSFQINVKKVNNVFSFTINSSPRGEQSRMTDTVMMLVCVCSTQAMVVM